MQSIYPHHTEQETRWQQPRGCVALTMCAAYKSSISRTVSALTSLCMILLLTMLTMNCALSSTANTDEYKIKAALIYKLTRFIEWPDNGNTNNHGINDQKFNFNICILGEDKFGQSINALETLKVNDTNVRIHRFKQSGNIINHCQLVFISDSKKPFLEEILQILAEQPVLTISDIKDFAEAGGMIEFTQSENNPASKRIGFKINLRQATKSKLKISAPLLELSTIVDSGKNGVAP